MACAASFDAHSFSFCCNSATLRQILQSDTCGCRGYDLESGDDYKFVLYHFDELEFLTADLDEDLKREIVKALCSGVLNYGEHGQVGDEAHGRLVRYTPGR